MTRLLRPLACSCFWLYCSAFILAQEDELLPGERYDFFCHDGQHVRNAEYLRPAPGGYVIRLPYSREEKVLRRDELLMPPRAVPGQNLVPGRRRYSLISLFGTVGSVHGALSDFISSARQFEIHYETEFFPGLVEKYRFMPSLSVMGHAGQYRGSARLMTGGGAGAGLAWELPLGALPALVWRVSAGFAAYDVEARTFRETSRAGLFSAAIGLRYRVGKLVFTLLASETALADSATSLYSTQGSLGVGYAF